MEEPILSSKLRWRAHIETPIGRLKLYLNDKLYYCSGIIVKLNKGNG